MRLLARDVIGLLAVAYSCSLAQAQPNTQTLECRGEEPFWYVELTDSSAVLSRPGSKETYKGQFQRFSYLKPQWQVWRGLPASGGEPLVLTMREESCHSTMAEGPAMPYRAVLSLRAGEAATGCCKVRAQVDARTAPAADFAAKPSTDWAKSLPDLLPAVRECIIDGGVLVNRVSKAWPMNRGMVGVRLVDLKGQRHDCIADSVGKSVDSVRPVTQSGSLLPGEGNPIFLPAREQPPKVECGRLERVNARGVLHGWLNYDPCR